jgi:hypothetical protein
MVLKYLHNVVKLFLISGSKLIICQLTLLQPKLFFPLKAITWMHRQRNLEKLQKILSKCAKFLKMREAKLCILAQKEFSDQSWLHIVISNSAPYNEQNYPACTPFKNFVAVSCCLKYGRNMQNLFPRLLQVLQLLKISHFTSSPE